MSYAAAPIFFLMAFVTYFQAPQMCTVSGDFGYLSTMWLMYVIMGAVHSSPWALLAWTALKGASRKNASKAAIMKFPAIVFAALTLVAWMLTGGVAQAQGIAYSDVELLAALESSYWIAVSGPHPKKVYVLAAPWCPVCRQLHKTLSPASPDIEYRFVLTAPRSQADRSENWTCRLLAGAHGSRRGLWPWSRWQGPGTPAETYADGLNDALWTAINPSLQARSAQPIGLPVLVFPSSGRLRVVAGMPHDLAALSASVDAMNAPSDPPPRLASLLAAPPELTPINAKVAYARHDGAVLRIAPHPAATKLAQVKTGIGFMAKAVTEQDGERWYAFQFVADGPPAAFGKVSDFR